MYEILMIIDDKMMTNKIKHKENKVHINNDVHDLVNTLCNIMNMMEEK